MSCSIFLLLVFHFLYAIPSQQSQERGTKIYLSISAIHLIFLLYIACLLYVWRRRNDWKQCKTCSIVVAWPFLDSCPVHNLHTTPLTVYTSTQGQVQMNEHPPCRQANSLKKCTHRNRFSQCTHFTFGFSTLCHGLVQPVVDPVTTM